MSDFSINIKVDLGVTPELTTLVMAVLQGRPTAKKELPETVQTVTAQTAQASAPAETAAEETASGAVEKPKRGRKPKAETAPAETTTDDNTEETEAVPASASGQEEAPKPEQTEADAHKQLSTADIREAMDKVRKRIEGEDYKNQTNSEPYKKYHQALSGEFINMAGLLGFKKPSDINTQEGMAAFIAQCEELAVDKDGSITHQVPF